MNKIKIAPSMLSCDFTHIYDDVKSIENSGADMLHLDVMDGMFVPNISFGMSIISQIRKCTDMYLDTHLMIEAPDRYVDQFVKAGSNNVTVHAEACEDVASVLKHIRSLGAAASLSVKPATPIESVYEYLHLCDMVLVMTVEPGFGGQKFMPDMLGKVEKLAERRKRCGLEYSIEVDGGINNDTVGAASAAGAEVFVAGSAVFGAADRALAVKELRTIAQKNI